MVEMAPKIIGFSKNWPSGVFAIMVLIRILFVTVTKFLNDFELFKVISLYLFRPD